MPGQEKTVFALADRSNKPHELKRKTIQATSSTIEKDKQSNRIRLSRDISNVTGETRYIRALNTQLLAQLNNISYCILDSSMISNTQKLLDIAKEIVEVYVYDGNGNVVGSSARSSMTSSSIQSMAEYINESIKGPYDVDDAVINGLVQDEQKSNLNMYEIKLTCKYLVVECKKLCKSINKTSIAKHKNNIIKFIEDIATAINAIEKEVEKFDRMSEGYDELRSDRVRNYVDGIEQSCASVAGETEQQEIADVAHQEQELVAKEQEEQNPARFKEQVASIELTEKTGRNIIDVNMLVEQQEIKEEARRASILTEEKVGRNTLSVKQRLQKAGINEAAGRRAIVCDMNLDRQEIKEAGGRAGILREEKVERDTVSVKKGFQEQEIQEKTERRDIFDTMNLLKDEIKKRSALDNIWIQEREKLKSLYNYQKSVTACNDFIKKETAERSDITTNETAGRNVIRSAILEEKEAAARSALLRDESAERDDVKAYSLRSSVMAEDLTRQRIQRERAAWENARERARQELQAREENRRNTLVSDEDAEREGIRDYSLRASVMAEDLARERIKHERAAWEDARERARQELQRQEGDVRNALLIDKGLGFNRITTEGLTSFRLSSDRANQRIQQQQQREREAREAMERARETERLRKEQADREAEAARQAAAARPRCRCD